MRRPVPADINAPFERALEYVRRCHHPGCPEPGAPRSCRSRSSLGVIPANDRINDLAGCGGVEVANAVLAGGLADSATDGIIIIGKHASS